jgi:hypothetical protein
MLPDGQATGYGEYKVAEAGRGTLYAQYTKQHSIELPATIAPADEPALRLCAILRASFVR